MKLSQINEKPRERIISYGAAALSDAELYALILTAGTRKSNVLDIAECVATFLSTHRQLPTLEELTQIRGIGTARACQILATLELSRRAKTCPANNFENLPVATSSREVRRLYQGLFAHSFAEELYALFLDSKLTVIACEQIFVGTLDSITIHPREVFHRAIKHLAHSVIIMHNHPSGDPNPSAQDLQATQMIQDVGMVVGIPLIDHIIFGASGFWSWSDSLSSQEILSDSDEFANGHTDEFAGECNSELGAMNNLSRKSTNDTSDDIFGR